MRVDRAGQTLVVRLVMIRLAVVAPLLVVLVLVLAACGGDKGGGY